MILNLAPVRTYHQDTLSSLNFANRTKKIEVREIENEPVFKGYTRAVPIVTGTSIQRQPLRPLTNSVHNKAVYALYSPHKLGDRQAKAFSVYSDKVRLSNVERMEIVRCSPLKRPSDLFPSSSRPKKRRSPDHTLFKTQPTISKEAIEKIIEDKVTDILAARALDQPSIVPQPEISEEVQRRLELLEKKIHNKDDGREQGLTFLLMAKQHTLRGEDLSALEMYKLAKNYFPGNKKLDLKIDNLREKTHQRKAEEGKNHRVIERSGSDPNNDRRLVDSDSRTDEPSLVVYRPSESQIPPKQRDSGVECGPANQRLFSRSSTRYPVAKIPKAKQDDSDYETEVYDKDNGTESDGGFHYKAKTKRKGPRSEVVQDQTQTPRTKQLLDIVNARDISQIRLLKGVGARKAEAIFEALCCADQNGSNEFVVRNLRELGRLRGVGPKTVENMRMGLHMVQAFR